VKVVKVPYPGVDGQRWNARGLTGCYWWRLPDGTWKRHRRFRIVTERVVSA
jgi:hypothetical protein